jgi:predicted dehydrogenase
MVRFYRQGSELQRTVVFALLCMAWLCFTHPARAENGQPQNGQPWRVGIVGLTHGHVAGLLPTLAQHPEIKLIGIVESDAGLVARYRSQFHLDAVPFYSTINELMEKQHPAALLVYTATSEHRRIIQDASAYGVSVMVEKPLATTLDDALAIRRFARQHRVHVLVNYETTWYASNAAAIEDAHQGRLGNVWKIEVHDGHRGPKEIGVQPEFLNWLTDPNQNGAGALFDFGCYGADLATVLMDGRTPQSVTTVLQNVKPGTYSRVDDDATVVLQYQKAQAILQPSWNWPVSRKDLTVYGDRGYAATVEAGHLRVRSGGDEQEKEIEAPSLHPPYDDSIHYLVAVLSGEVDPSRSLSGIDTNVIVMQILDAARESARTHRTVTLRPLSE